MTGSAGSASSYVLRPATAPDCAAIAGIYAHAVRTSTATFDLSEPASSSWEQRILSGGVGDHVLVVSDGTGVLGFAYSGTFRTRAAYAGTRETSVYIAPGATGVGIGQLVYSRLLQSLRADGIHVAVAVVAQPNPASVALHERLGFELVGTFREVGRKFDRWVDTQWYQLILDRQG